MAVTSVDANLSVAVRGPAIESGDLLAGHVPGSADRLGAGARATRLPGQAAAQLAVPEGGAIRYKNITPFSPKPGGKIPGACGHWAL